MLKYLDPNFWCTENGKGIQNSLLIHTTVFDSLKSGFWMTLDITDGASEAKLLLNDEYISNKIGISASEFKSKAANTNSKDELLNVFDLLPRW